MRRLRPLLLLVVALVGAPAAAQAPSAGARVDTVRHAVPVAAFSDARALGVDPFGRLYVPDAGADAVRILSPSGEVETLGGPGGSEGEFDDPSDVDPTNGLVLLVADAGNGRIQRFSRTHAYLGALPVGRAAGEDASQPSYGRRDGVFEVHATGRPVAVATAGTNETYAVDAEQNVVLHWDRGRRFVGAIGGRGAGPGTLVEPVALAVGRDRTLYVADRGQAAVLAYDAFGAFLRAFAYDRAPDVRALFTRDEQLWIVLPDRLLVYSTHGGLERELVVRLAEPLVDAAVVDGAGYLLTSTRLYRVTGPAEGF